MITYYYLVKPTKSIQLGHLYEHLICLELMDIFKSHGLYLHSDYDLLAKMYYGGMIYFEVTCYTENHPVVSEILPKIKINYDKYLDSAISTLYAEHQRELKVSPKAELIKLLEQLHSQPWTSLDDLGSIDANDFMDKPSGIDFKNDDFIKLKKFTLSVTYNNPDEDLLVIPLVRQALKIISYNISNAIADKYGMFSNYDSFKKVKSGYKLGNTMTTGLIDYDTKDCLNIAHDFFLEMKNSGVFERFIDQLQNLSLSMRPEASPNFENSYENTLVFTGTKGWKDIATRNNLERILNNITFKVR